MSSLFSPGVVLLVRWTVLLALGWCVHGLLRQQHSRGRQFLWRCLLGFGLALPLMQFVTVPTLRIPIYRAPAAAMPGADRPAIVASSKPVPEEQPTIAAPAKPVDASAPKTLTAPPLLAATKPFPWTRLLVVAWGVGAVFAGFRLTRLQLRLARLRQESRPAGPVLQEQTHAIQRKLEAPRQIGVRVSETVGSPFACGLFQPAIMLPQKLVQELPSDEISALLAHEIAHFRRHDLFWCVGWRWMQAVCWFHPLVWKIPAAHNLACEEEADRVASGQLEDPEFYPQLLARLALRVLALPAVETRLALNGTSQITQRLNYLRRGKVRAWTWRHSATGFALAGLVFLATVGSEFSKAAPVQTAAAGKAEFNEVHVVVHDQDGKPIVGATILPTGYRMKGVRWQDAFGWSEELFGPPVKAHTDSQGQASIRYPVVGNPEENDLTDKVFLEVAAPEFVGTRTEFPVDGPQKPIRLTRGIHLEVSGYFGAEHQPVTEIVPEVNFATAEEWVKKEKGVLALGTLSPGGHLLQLMGRLSSGEIVYSDSFPFTADAGQGNHFALEMKPGIRLEGRLDDRVPRPVRDGRVLISVRPKESSASAAASKRFDYGNVWRSYRTISTDGSFVFESIPPGEVDVVVHGDGFVSRSIEKIPNGLRNGEPIMVDGPSIGFAVPQSFGLTAPVTKIEVLTEPTSTLELTAKSKDGKSIAGATVGLSPNVIRMGGILGEMGRTPSSEEPFRTLPPLPNLYSATTDASGLGVIRNVPVGVANWMWVFHPQYNLPLEGRHREVRVKFLPEETNKVEVVLVAKGDTSRDSSEEDLKPRPPPGMSLVDRAAAHFGASGQDDPDLLKLGNTIVTFIRERDPRIFKDQIFVTSDMVWAAFQETGEKGPTRKEMDEQLNPHLEQEWAKARSVVQQMEDAGIDLKNAAIQITEASVEKLRSPPGRNSVIGLSGEKFKLKIAVTTPNKAKNGTSLSGEYILAANELVRFAEGWRVGEEFHWEKLPAGLMNTNAIAAVEFENHVAETGTLPLATVAPDVEFTSLVGEKRMKLSDLRGKVVVLEFWATWCGPCQEPMAKMQTFRQAHPDWQDQVALVPLSIDDTLKIVRDHVERRAWTNTFNAWAGAGGFMAKPAGAFRVNGVPTTYIIDAQGKIVKAGNPATMDVGEEVDGLLKH
jgi:beta-lactamase regulating signal transducer with metallopeptidase domain/thiol-disulfide isomerase/thioredoxin